MPRADDAASRARVGDLIARTLGLHFPPPRWPDLERGLTRLADDLGIDGADACARRLLDDPRDRQLQQMLAVHLTVGETYFFRDDAALDALRSTVLPQLIASRASDRRLRLWSAGCCTGEEPYTLSMLLHDALPDIDRWQLDILGTDINPRFLERAADGSYTEWSFRNTSEMQRQRWFAAQADGRWAVRPAVRRAVRFEQLNLADPLPPAITAGPAIDLLVCRNVLMYLSPATQREAIARFRGVLAEDGWLLVSACETSERLFRGWARHAVGDVVLYRPRGPVGTPLPIATAAAPALPATAPRVRTAAPGSAAPCSASAPRRAQAPIAVQAKPPSSPARSGRSIASALETAARAHADRGEHDAARRSCERWLALDKLQPSAHYLHARILLEQGASGDARQALRRTLYLQPEFVMAHVMLGHLELAEGRIEQARGAFGHALQILRELPSDASVAEADGLDAGALFELVATVLATGSRA